MGQNVGKRLHHGDFFARDGRIVDARAHAYGAAEAIGQGGGRAKTRTSSRWPGKTSSRPWAWAPTQGHRPGLRPPDGAVPPANSTCRSPPWRQTQLQADSALTGGKTHISSQTMAQASAATAFPPGARVVARPLQRRRAAAILPSGPQPQGRCLDAAARCPSHPRIPARIPASLRTRRFWNRLPF